MKTSSAKAKGKRLFEEVQEDLLDLYPELESWDIQSPANSVPGEDVLMSPRAEALIGLSFELKNQERLGIWSAIQQAISNAKNRVPVVVFRKNRTPAWIAQPWAYWLVHERNRRVATKMLRELEGRSAQSLKEIIDLLED